MATGIYKRIADLRVQAKRLENEAADLERETVDTQGCFMVIERIQDGRPRCSGPMAWDEAVEASNAGHNRYIADYGPLLP